MIIITAHWKAQKGKESALKICLEAMVEKVREEEKDCLEYILHQDSSDNTQFFFYEQYDSQEAFNFHKSTTHFQTLINNTKDLIDGDVQVKSFDLIV